MGITHVIRGDDHLNNTPRQMQILQALGADLPIYAHVPMILGPDKQKLSKRHGAVSVLEYREQGFLPDALLNFLIRLGWSHGDEEIFSREQMIEFFQIDTVNKAASAFNPEKLLWINAQHMQRLSPQGLAQRLRPYLDAHGITEASLAQGPDLSAVVALLQERAKTLVEMAGAASMFYLAPVTAEVKDVEKHLYGQSDLLESLFQHLETLPIWTAAAIHSAIQELAVSHAEGKMGKIAQPLRVAVAGRAVSPPIDGTLALLGKDETLARIRHARSWLAAV
jgi:glutamyl-tRNA synthetase